DHGVVTGEHFGELLRIADVTLYERVPGAGGDRGEVREVARVRELIVDGDLGVLVAGVTAGQQRADVVRADEARTAGNQDPHELICTLLWPPTTSRCARGTRGAGVTSA